MLKEFYQFSTCPVDVLIIDNIHLFLAARINSRCNVFSHISIICPIIARYKIIHDTSDLRPAAIEKVWRSDCYLDSMGLNADFQSKIFGDPQWSDYSSRKNDSRRI